jgi:hypothetical protein
MIEVLKTIVKISAVMNRQSPNDFAIDGALPQSGFAKLIDSIPKLEAKAQRAARMKAIEERILWPRIGASLRYLDVLPDSATRLKLRVEFAKDDYIRSIDEESRQNEFDFKWGLSSPADVLAKRRGIARDEAEQIIADNKGKEPEKPEENGNGMLQAPRQSLVERIVARTKGPRLAD